jgi:Flp pilus assembly protein TadD
LLLIGLALAATGVVWGIRIWKRGLPPSPSFVSPFLNTRLDVEYVGSARCAECHVKEASSYSQHPMGRSVSPARQALPGQDRAKPEFETAGIHYSVRRDAKEVVHRAFVVGNEGQTAIEQAAEIAFAVGSGRQGQSFLFERDGRLFQSPVSWFTQDHSWRISPGFERNNELFNRPAIEACLYCHTNAAPTEPDTINHFRLARGGLESIGCERCHGPGALHVAARMSQEAAAVPDRTIVNPRHLEPYLRDAICEQCHLQGESRIVRRGRSPYDYRPGLPLHEFLAVFVLPPERTDSRKAVSQIEQMHQSRCFQASAGKMGCTSCHDPHELPSARERVAWYRGRCLSCHEENSCSLAPDERRRQEPADSCIVCHMPHGDSSNVAHAAITDHRVVRRPGQSRPAAPSERPGSFLNAFHGDLSGERDGDPRDLGLALAELIRQPIPEPQRSQIARQACSLLTPAVERAPDDVAALEGLGYALGKERRPREALAVLEKALERSPRRELALERAARVAMELGDSERSAACWQRLVEVNPYTWQSHGFLAQTLAQREQWSRAVEECRASFRLNPFETRTRMLLIDCLIRTGEKTQAQSEFETLLAANPTERERLRRWFDELTRGR